MNERIRRLRAYPMVELARRKAELVARGVDVLDFGTGDPIEPTAPFIRQALADAVPVISQYPSVEGTRTLRRACAAWAERRFGVALDPDREILPSGGSKEAMFHLPLVLVDPSTERDTVVYPVPGYPVMEIGSLYASAQVHEVPLTADNSYLMDPAALPVEVLDRAAIVWINYPHNPTGQDLPESLWEAWVAARREHGFVLCSDECYTEIYDAAPPASVLQFDREGCLAFHSLSKRSGMTAYRSGFVAGDGELIARYKAARAGMGVAPPIWTQAASEAAWSDEAHVEERRRIFAAKRALMTEGLMELGHAVYPTTSTFYLWVAVPDGETDATWAARLLEAGLVVSPGSFFGPGNERFVRFALVPDLTGCAEALRRMETA
ncbi:MAG: succinyldiaminopimelate transaminase [Planctomycetes bacterium]|nr:succinyldiaminopimelate transaminase [Planctomycetota bacterium]MCB9901952.1 succinyldiaminopimelate transaminase [Planctomycetota bacterium]